MNADHEEAVEFAKISKRENRVYVGNLSYDVKYRDLMEFMRGGGWGNFRLVFRCLWCGGEGVALVAGNCSIRACLGQRCAFLRISCLPFLLFPFRFRFSFLWREE